jgi:hypothetical protein
MCPVAPITTTRLIPSLPFHADNYELIFASGRWHRCLDCDDQPNVKAPGVFTGAATSQLCQASELGTITAHNWRETLAFRSIAGLTAAYFGMVKHVRCAGKQDGHGSRIDWPRMTAASVPVHEIRTYKRRLG